MAELLAAMVGGIASKTGTRALSTTVFAETGVGNYSGQSLRPAPTTFAWLSRFLRFLVSALADPSVALPGL
jgi:hypothetical protein